MIVFVNRDQDLAEALDSEGSDTEMERGIVQVQEHSAQHRAKMWKVESIMRKIAKKNAVLFHDDANFSPWKLNTVKVFWGGVMYESFRFSGFVIIAYKSRS